MRAVLDPNVIISALISPHGSPARVLRLWLAGAFELVVSPLLLDELARALRYPKISERVTAQEADEIVELLRSEADLHNDPAGAPPIRSRDPGDDYLIALAAETRSVIVSGDSHLLDLDDVPVYASAAFLAVIEPSGG